MKADCLGPYPRESIYCHEHNCQAGRVEHEFRTDVISALDEPVNINACSLSGYRDEEEVGKNKAVEGLNFILESGHNDYSCTQRIT